MLRPFCCVGYATWGRHARCTTTELTKLGCRGILRIVADLERAMDNRQGTENMRGTPSFVTAIVVMAVLLDSPAQGQLANSGWAKFHGDLRNSGYTSVQAGGGRRKWEASAGGTMYAGTSAAIGPDRTIYVDCGNGIKAYTPAGGVRWSFAGGVGSCTPAVGADGTIYYGNHASKFYAINPNGTQKWAVDISGSPYESSPTIDAQGNVYFSTWDGHLYSLSGATGQVNWVRSIPGGASNSSPALFGGSLYVCGWDSLYAYDLQGQRTWALPTGQIGFASPTVATDGTIYIGSIQTQTKPGKLTAVTPSGSILWQALTGGTQSSAAIAADGTIYTVTTDSVLKAFSSSGDLLWSYLAPGISQAHWGSPIVDGAGIVYYTGVKSGSEYLLAVNSDGTERWRAITSGTMSTSPIIAADGTIYVPTGGLTAFVPEPSSLLSLIVSGLIFGAARRRSTTGV